MEYLRHGCPACGHVNPGDAGNCMACGQPLVSGDDAPRGFGEAPPERRQLSVLFCDMMDSTALSHRLDPEDLFRVVRSYQERAARLVAPYAGHVAQYRGDGILVYFGYPQAREDAATNAIQAALDIVQALKQSPLLPGHHEDAVKVRIGIATGMVVVADLTGQGLVSQAEAMGETPNLAARLQGLARPNGILIAPRTRELAGSAFDYEDMGPHELKGFPRPVRVWRVLGPGNPPSRFVAAHGRKHEPLVGRKDELAAMRTAWQRAVGGKGQILVLRGEGGIGKSRLVEAFANSVTAERQRRLSFQCSPYHTQTSLHPVIDHLQRVAGFARDDKPERKLHKLQAMLARGAPAAAEVGALHASLLSLPAGQLFPTLELTPQQRKERTLAMLLERMRRLTTDRPLLVVLEDAHWIDPTTAELLEMLASQVDVLPMLAIVTTRPDVDGQWLGPKGTATLLLDRLDAECSRELLRRLVGDSELSPELAEQIIVRADGVPLFIEELAKTFAAGGPARNALVPATLQDSLMARLDRLGTAKEVAQLASVIGREFSREHLAFLTMLDEPHLGAALDRLVSSSVLQAGDSAPHGRFVFRHALLQDAAYASLMRGRRQELHGRLAAWLETSHPELASAEPELLAHHFTAAGAPAAAARYRAVAAHRALDRSANREALSHADQGLALLPALAAGDDRDRLEMQLQILRGTACRAVSGFAATQGEQSFHRALELCELLGDLPRMADARRGLFACYYARGALTQARAQGQQLAELGLRTGDVDSRMLGHWMLGCMTFWQGEFATARRELETATSLYDSNSRRTNALALQIDPGVNALLHLSWTRWILGLPDHALRTSEQAVATARALLQPFALAMALFWACCTQSCCGRQAQVRELLDELLALTRQHGLGYLGSCARVLRAEQLVVTGHAAEGLEQLAHAFEEFQAQQAGVGLPWAISVSVRGHAALGQLEAAGAALDAAMKAGARNGERHWEAELWRLKGELQQAASAEATASEASFRAAMDLARLQSAKSLELRAATSLGRLLAGQRRFDVAAGVLGPVLGTFEEGFDTADLRAAQEVLDALG